MIRPQSPDQPAQADKSERKKIKAKEPKVKASSKSSKTLEESQKIKCLLDNPKTRGMKPYERYEKYKFATTVKEFYEKGGTPADLGYSDIPLVGGSRLSLLTIIILSHFY